MVTNAKVLLVVNPISGGIDKSEIIAFLKATCAQGQKELGIYYTSGQNDREQLRKILEELAPERILVIGGDGTIKMMAELLDGTKIPIGLFPEGSANGLAENLDLPAELEQRAQVALGKHFMEMDCIEVNGELCLHISDIGLNAELIKNYEEGRIRGKLGYFLQSIPTLIKSNFPFHFTIRIGEEELEQEAVLIAIANARKYGTGATINPQGKLDDGQFEILVFKKFNIPEILRTFQENVRPSTDFLEIFPAREATIVADKPLPFQVDGEFRGELKKISASLSHTKIRLAVPQHLATTAL